MVAPKEMNSPAGRGGRTDYEQVLRSLALLIAAGYLGYAILLAARVYANSVFVAPWWTVTAVLLTLVLPPILLVLSARFATAMTIRHVGAIVAALFLIVALLWPWAWRGVALPGSHWMAFIPGLAAMAAALAWRWWITMSYLLAATTAAQWLNQHREAAANFAFGLEMLYSYGFSLVFVAMILKGLRTARDLDLTRAATEEQVAATAAAQTRARQRLVHAALVHDWVIATLLAAAKLPHSERLQWQAERTLAKMDSIPLVTAQGTVTAADAVDTIRSAVAEVAATVDMEVLTNGTGGDFDADAVRAAAEGAAEAVRNSMRHNTSDVRCEVRVIIEAQRFRILVTDDGAGFDTAEVPADRFGVRGSIDQLNHLAGGKVTICSVPGRGVRVTFEWRRPETNGPPDIRVFLGIRTPGAAVVTVLYLLGITALAIMSTHGPLGRPAIAGLLLYAAMAATFLTTPRDPLAPWAVGAATFGPLGAATALWDMDPLHSPEQLWPASATAAIYALLMLRGRATVAWLGQGSVVVISAVWAQSNGFPLLPLFISRLADFAPLIGCAAFAAMVRPRLHAIVELRHHALQLMRQEVAAHTAVNERRSQLKHFDTITRPLLSRIAGNEPLRSDERRNCLLVEARLRDSLRGGILSAPALAQSIQDARERGVEVLLYDDHGADGCTPADHESIFAAVVAELAVVGVGQVVIRIPPPGRDILATIVIRTPGGTRRRAVVRTP
ncbi:ATP-binding protein [Nocardia brasiliensis]|uniref:ATP-binding protein n=2 Tax=Nocardia brasiliensis TaxID=37326 RepID=UPI00189543B5|nr:ATP-binding protein [Nocardia brasiliensis]MBF6543403.1 sensor histidine kinase [Nocardia brasiliensis]